jgi:hypothetical protein
VLTIVFFIEMVLKVMSYGFHFGEPTTYFKCNWNKMDFFLVVCSSIEMSIDLLTGYTGKIVNLFRIIRMVKALKPLRIINRFSGLKSMIEALISSMLTIGKIVIICFMLFIVFAILGVQLFRGTFYHCVGSDIENVRTKNECLSIPENKWRNYVYNFDHLGKALLTLFILSAKDGWIEIMYFGMDSVGIDMQPIENNNRLMMIYFVLFILIIGFFILNMFVGVIVDNFNVKTAKEEEKKEKIIKQKAKPINASLQSNFVFFFVVYIKFLIFFFFCLKNTASVQQTIPH